MKIEPRELQEIERAQPPRVDLYAGIHKALRALMADTLVAVGRMDCDDALSMAQTTQRLMQLLELCGTHLVHENAYLHTAIEARAPGASEAIAHDHGEHQAAIEALAGRATALLNAPAAERAARALALYRELALFVAHNFQHMHVEETAHNAVLWARYTDAELVAIHEALVASIPPQEMMFVLRWMVPSMNPAERTGMMADMQVHAPAPAFAAAMATVRPHLDAHEWQQLVDSLPLALPAEAMPPAYAPA